MTRDTDRLAYRISVLPKQLEAARAKLRRLEAEARRYGFFDLLDAAEAAAGSTLSGPAPLGRSGAAHNPPVRGAIGGER
ncbi:MAG: hypothetical protein IE932_10825 [Sphingopyxis terrae]|nr:hypothetical protein [Sphingopyxis terrae]